MILDIAAAVFAEHGFANARLDEVARRLGLTRQGLLHYHPSKEALFRAVLERDRAWAVQASATGIDADRPLDSLGRFLGTDSDSRERVRLQQVLQGEAIAGNEVAREYVRQRTDVITADVRRRVALLAEQNRLAQGWSISSATTMLVALINGSQALTLIAGIGDARDAFARTVAGLITERTIS